MGDVGTTVFQIRIRATSASMQLDVKSAAGGDNPKGCHPIHRRNAMRRILRRTGWASLATFFSAAMMAAGMSFISAPAQAGFELPEGERITNLPAIPRAMPQKEAYELYDPAIGRNFDIKNFWLRADIRVRPEMRNGVCFGGGNPAAGVCNTTAAINTVGSASTANAGKAASDQFVQQWVRLGIGYDLSPDVNFYFELIDSATWGANATANNAGNNGDP